jgi:excisionase family DNA binding protein
MSALIEIFESQIEEARGQHNDLNYLSSELAHINREVESLRGIVNQFEKIVKSYKPIEWLTTVQAAALLNVHEDTIRVWYKAGRLPGYQLEKNGHIRFDRNEISEAIKKAG